MPFFSQAPSSSLAASLRRAVGGSGGQIDPLQEIEIDAKAASTAHNLAMVDKLRAEVKAKQDEQQMRTDPARAAEYAGNVAGMDRPNALRLAANLRGDTEQPSVADVEDAAIVGREAAPFRVTAPEVNPAQRGTFQRALAAIGANLLATGHTNADQLTQAQGNLQTQDLTQRVQDAIASGRVQDASAMNQGAKPGTAIRLFDNVGNTGATFAPATGDVQADPKATPNNSLLKGTLDKIRADIGQSNAAAGASGAHAGLFNAQADKVRNPGAGEALGKPPQGYRWGPMDAEGAPTLVPIAGGPAESKATSSDSERVSAGYASRMQSAEKILTELGAKGTGKPEAAERIISALPGNAGKDAANAVMSNERQKYRQAQEDWVRAKLRKESGAVIGEEEMDREIRVYFPQIGDKAEVVKQKAAARKTAEAAMLQAGGRAIPHGGAAKDQAAPETSKVLNGVTYVKVDGKWYQR